MIARYVCLQNADKYITLLSNIYSRYYFKINIVENILFQLKLSNIICVDFHVSIL